MLFQNYVSYDLAFLVLRLIEVFLSSQSYQCSPFFLRKQQIVYLAAFDISAYCVMDFFSSLRMSVSLLLIALFPKCDCFKFPCLQSASFNFKAF